MTFLSSAAAKGSSSTVTLIAFLLILNLGTPSCIFTKKIGAEKRYQLKGKIISVDRANEKIEIEHEDVAGLMKGMTMSFSLKDRDALRTAAAGDQIQATLAVGDDGAFWLENPIIIKGTPAAATATAQADEPGAAREPQAGDEVPDFRVVNQDGVGRHLREYRGRALLLTFIYTRCPQEEYCPLMSTNFAQINRATEHNPALREGVHLLSVTIDPEHDTPKVLRSYGAAYTENYADETFARWEFATGEIDEVKRIANFFGLTYNAEQGQIVHSLRTVLIGGDGRVAKVYRGNEWKPSEVIADLQSAVEHTQTGR